MRGGSCRGRGEPGGPEGRGPLKVGLHRNEEVCSKLSGP